MEPKEIRNLAGALILSAVASSAVAQGLSIAEVMGRDAPDLQGVTALRQALRDNPDIARTFFQSDIHPILTRDASPLVAGDLAEIAAHGIAVEGCADERRIIGFYSPFLHAWMVVALGREAVEPGGRPAIMDATLGTGFPASDGEMFWWPDALAEGMDFVTAVQLATQVQIEAFQSWFSEDACPPLDSGAFSPSAAVVQLGRISAEWPAFREDLKPLFVADFSEKTGVDISDWSILGRLPATDPDWIVIFTSAAYPGRAIVARWERRATGNVHYAGHAGIPFFPHKEGGSNEGSAAPAADDVLQE